MPVNEAKRSHSMPKNSVYTGSQATTSVSFGYGSQINGVDRDLQEKRRKVAMMEEHVKNLDVELRKSRDQRDSNILIQNTSR